MTSVCPKSWCIVIYEVSGVFLVGFLLFWLGFFLEGGGLFGYEFFYLIRNVVLVLSGGGFHEKL